MHRLACVFSVYPKEKVHERALAILFFEDAYRIRSELYSDEIDHPDVVISLVELCHLMVEEELWSKSLPYITQLLDVRRREYPHEDHVDLCDTYLTAALVMCRNNDLLNAKSFCTKGLDISCRLYGENDKKTANAYTLLAEIYEAEGFPNKARKFHEMALKIRQKIYHGPHHSTAESLESIGQMYLLATKYEKAFLQFQEALDIRREIHSNYSSSTGSGSDEMNQSDIWMAYTLTDCVRALILEEKYEEAKAYAIEGMRIRNIVCRKSNSLLVAESMIQLACIHTALGEHEEATPLLSEALEIRLQELGPLALFVAELYHLLGENYQARGMVPQAEGTVLFLLLTCSPHLFLLSLSPLRNAAPCTEPPLQSL
jgi:tetratricopeptide (TPR) repeat protein